MLAKPRRWLAYTVEVNDQCAAYDHIVDRFEHCDIPLDSAFGSNTVPGLDVPGLLIAAGPAVEPARLAEIVDLLDGLGQLFILVDDDLGEHDKMIAIGALNLTGKPVVAVGGAVLAVLERADATADELREVLERAPHVHVLAGRSVLADER